MRYLHRRLLLDVNGGRTGHTEVDAAWPHTLPRGVNPSGARHGLEIVPPFVIVSAEVSWQLAGMLRCAGLVLA
jgi:hypothetical protein